MHLIYHENNIACSFYFLYESENSRLKLTAELRTCHKSGKIQHPNLKSRQSFGYPALNNSRCKLFYDSRFTDTRLTYKTGVILLSAAKNLDHTVDFSVTADNLIYFAVRRFFVEICAIRRKQLFRCILALCISALLTRSLTSYTIGTHRHAKELSEIKRRNLSSLRVIIFRNETRLHKTVDLRGHILNSFLVNTHLLQHIGNRSYTKFRCASETQTFVHGLIVFNFCNKDHSRSFLTS